jgi:hypothetical protein
VQRGRYLLVREHEGERIDESVSLSEEICLNCVEELVAQANVSYAWIDDCRRIPHPPDCGPDRDGCQAREEPAGDGGHRRERYQWPSSAHAFAE